MILLVFSVYDKAVNAFMQPFYSRSRGEAIRSFTEACNDASSNFAKYPSDYYLAFLGQYDDSSGLFACGDPVRIIGATEVFRDEAEGLASAIISRPPVPRAVL